MSNYHTSPKFCFLEILRLLQHLPITSSPIIMEVPFVFPKHSYLHLFIAAAPHRFLCYVSLFICTFATAVHRSMKVVFFSERSRSQIIESGPKQAKKNAELYRSVNSKGQARTAELKYAGKQTFSGLLHQDVCRFSPSHPTSSWKSDVRRGEGGRILGRVNLPLRGEVVSRSNG